MIYDEHDPSGRSIEHLNRTLNSEIARFEDRKMAFPKMGNRNPLKRRLAVFTGVSKRS